MKKKKDSVQKNQQVLYGSDYLGKVRLAGNSQLDSGIANIFTINIAPSKFKTTRLELLSNVYQFYRFKKMYIRYTPNVTTSNANLLAFFSLDPDDLPHANSAEEILRLAKSHKGSEQLKANSKFAINMPAGNKEKWFYTVGSEEQRLSVQAVFYLYQIGNATNYIGQSITKGYDAGTLDIDWEIEFKNPQLNGLNRITDGSSQKDVIRLFKSIASYQSMDFGNITATNNYITDKYRVANHPVDMTMLPKGSYLVQQIPVGITLPNSLRSCRTYSPSGYENDPHLGLGGLLTAGKIDTKGIMNFINKAWKIAEGGIGAAIKIFDVIELVLPLFNADQPTGTQVDVTYDFSTQLKTFNPIGYSVITYDGITAPLIEVLFEFKDQAHAQDTNVVVAYKCVTLLYPLEENTLNSYEKLAKSTLPLRLPSSEY